MGCMSSLGLLEYGSGVTNGNPFRENTSIPRVKIAYLELTALASSCSGLKSPIPKIKQDIFSLIDDNADLSKEPFSKLKRDMASELGLV